MFLFLFLTSITIAQETNDKTLLTINGKDILASEFIRVYKKNLEIIDKDEQNDLDSYLKLFVDYKLKLEESYAQQLDTLPIYIHEFNRHKDQLLASYLFDKKVTDDLINEAFDRQQKQVYVNHILLYSKIDELPKDTLIVYNKIKKIRADILSGKIDFETAARKYSDDPNAASNGGDLGWFSAFVMVYPFETAAFTTPVGEVSEIVHTQFGYHILLVKDRRKLPNDVTAAHIMITNVQKDTTVIAEQRIKEIYAKYKQGELFEDLAKQFSEDKNTAKTGGLLKQFGPGKLNSKAFEEATFSLKNVGDVSEPFKTDYGWHIVKLIERHPKITYEEALPLLDKRIQRAQRLDIINNVTTEKIKNRYGVVTNNEEVISFFSKFINEAIKEKKWVFSDSLNPKMTTPLFTLDKTHFTYKDFAKYIETRQVKSRGYKNTLAYATIFYNEFEQNTLRDYFDNNIELEDVAFGAIVNEYREGLLIFDLMDKNIWKRVRRDTLGLQKYFETNIESYHWNTRVNGLIAVTTDAKIAKKVKSLLKKGNTKDEIKEKVNKGEIINVIFTEGIFEIGDRELPESYKPELGVSKVYNTSTNFTVVKVREILPKKNKEFDDVKGKVMGDYQNYLEKEFIENLHAKFPVKIHNDVLELVKKQLQK